MKNTGKNQPPYIPRVCALHDLSSFGRCALTVVIPTLSAMGIQTVPLPTAVMSTHTGGFSDIHTVDMTEHIRPIYEHWVSLGVDFDAVYSGFVPNTAQGELIGALIDTFRQKKPDMLVLVDPVMGDDGVLYSACTPEFCDMMRVLCRKADVITPNLTEACMLCGVAYPDGEMSRFDADALCSRLFPKLLSLSPKAVITGIPLYENDRHFIGTAFSEREKEKWETVTEERVGQGYPGTGELFSSVLLGKMLSHASLLQACREASAFTRDTIAYSERAKTPKREGLSLEPCLCRLFSDKERLPER